MSGEMNDQDKEPWRDLIFGKKDDYFGFSQLSKWLGKYGLTTQGHVLVEEVGV